MSVLIDERNLILGNGDLFFALDPSDPVATQVASLPSIAQYKAAQASGTMATLAAVGGVNSNVGAIKGTATIQLIREVLPFEIGVPQETAAQAVIREGAHIKVALAELNLLNVKNMLGTQYYSTTTAGSTKISNEVVTLQVDSEGNPMRTVLAHDPILFTDSTPAATANPVVKTGTTNAGDTLVVYTDYVIDYLDNSIMPVHGSTSCPTDDTHPVTVNVTYYYNALSTEVLTGGGEASVSSIALAFFHPYADGRVARFVMRKANPMGTVSLPFEEIAWSHTELEMKAIADFSQASGAHLWQLIREVF